ncbi:MAG: 2-amino-4-hydroxy-6-hydroxymethyldihydropteridine diphosphokinase [Bacteroidetes bacterium]|nr:2-amino-4-hydroxy-6-hydroxymethyldihydropteridine diphosphokinase [Bacteroidota bacterium]
MISYPVFLSLGSNLGNRAGTLRQAIDLLAQVCTIKNQSSVYETAAWGNPNQPNYLNQVVEVTTSQSPAEFLQTLHVIENQLGRTRSGKWEARVIDIDILYFANQIINSPELTVPHPYLTERKFVLIPLVEISPQLRHPVVQKKNEELLRVCSDPSVVKRITD